MIRQTEVEAKKKAVTVAADDGMDLGGDVAGAERAELELGESESGVKMQVFFCIHDLVFFFFKPKSQLYL